MKCTPHMVTVNLFDVITPVTQSQYERIMGMNQVYHYLAYGTATSK
jgi:hypothetical protein